MLSEHFNTKPDKDGEYFVDRSPKHFGLILDYLRDPKRGVALVSRRVEKFDDLERDEFEMEVDFYQIQSMIQFVRKNTTYPTVQSTGIIRMRKAIIHPDFLK